MPRTAGGHGCRRRYRRLDTAHAPACDCRAKAYLVGPSAGLAGGPLCPRPHRGQFDFQAEPQKRSDEHNSGENCDGLERRADGHCSDDVRCDEEFETEQDCAADLLPKAAVHLRTGAAKAGPRSGEWSARCPPAIAVTPAASTPRPIASTALVEAHAFRLASPRLPTRRPVLRRMIPTR
jgi:hypothetical protein